MKSDLKAPTIKMLPSKGIPDFQVAAALLIAHLAKSHGAGDGRKSVV